MAINSSAHRGGRAGSAFCHIAVRAVRSASIASRGSRPRMPMPFDSGLPYEATIRQPSVGPTSGGVADAPAALRQTGTSDCSRLTTVAGGGVVVVVVVGAATVDGAIVGARTGTSGGNVL